MLQEQQGSVISSTARSPVQNRGTGIEHFDAKYAVEKLGLSVPIQVIGAGEVVSAILLLVPRTASLGILLTSGFWGGAICLHLSKGEPFVVQSVFLLLTWVGAYLRVPGTFASFAVSSLTEGPIANASKDLVV